MSIKNNWLRSLSVMLTVVLLLTAVGSYLMPGQDIIPPFISGSVSATPDQQLTELRETYNRTDHSNLDQHMKFEQDAEDGKVTVIIGFSGEPARGAQRQAALTQQKRLVQSFGGEVERGFTIINAVTARLPLQAVEALSRRHNVSYIEPDYEVFLIAQETPWGIDRIFGPEKYTFPTWEHSRGQGIAVAVLDTGIDENHIDLPVILGGVNTIDSTHWGSDGHGHGTHVAGTIAAVDNNMGVVGAAPDAGLYAVKVLNDKGRGTYSSVIAGIEWAFNKNIPVINMSLGGGSHSKALKDAVDAAYAGGTLLVAAAGNGGDSTDNVNYPARYSSVIAVSASGSNDNLASFSSRGPSVEFIAPGVSILSLVPDNSMVRWSGTSMAAPHVAGSAATLWGVNPNLSNLEVRNTLRQTAQDLGLSSDHQGYGLVRADLAVLQAMGAFLPAANLSGLTVSKGELKPAFDSAITEYTVEVAGDISSIDITATLSDTNSIITINGAPGTSGEPVTADLEESGTETIIDIVVTAIDEEKEETYTVTVNRAILCVEEVILTANPERSQQAGEPVTFTAEVTAGNEAAEYAFWYQLPGGSWREARAYSTDNSWTVSTNYVGEVLIGVQARAVGAGFEQARALLDYEISAVSPVEEIKLQANPEKSQQAGEPITFTAEVTAGNEAAEYAFWYQLPGGSWKEARAYITDNSWTVSTNYLGEVMIRAEARAVGSKALDEASDILEYEITAPE